MLLGINSKVGAITCPIKRMERSSEDPSSFHLKVSLNSPGIEEEKVIYMGILSPTPKVPFFLSNWNIFPKLRSLGCNSKLQSISPRFSIITS